MSSFDFIADTLLHDCHPSKSKGDLFLRGLTHKDSETPPQQPFSYRSIIGCLQHLASHSRPDISFETATFAKFCQKPGVIHVRACQQLLRYLKHTCNWGLLLGGKDTPELYGFADATEYAEHETARGTGGYVFKFGNGTISHKSKWYRNIYPSFTEAELVALYMATSQTIWLRKIMDFFLYSTQLPTTIHVDNDGALKYCHNLDKAGRMRHINIKFQFIREKIQSNVIATKLIPTFSNSADIMTKTLRGSKLQTFSKDLGLQSMDNIAC